MKLLSLILKLIGILLALLVLVFVVKVAPIAIQNYKGYCRAENRYVSDEEKIRNVIDRVNAPTSMKFTYRQREKGRYLPEQYIPYNSVDEFLAKNKDCCYVTKKGDQDSVFPVTFWGRIWGTHSDNVRVNFVATYRNTKGKVITDRVSTARQVSNCGKLE